MVEVENQFKSDLAALRFLVDAGLDVVVDAEPRNRLAEPEPVAEVRPGTPRPAAPAAPARPASRPAPAEPMDGERQAVELARSIAPACRDLAELRAALEAFEGLSIKQMATRLVLSDGNPEAEIIIIGEAPGREEDRTGKPFVGEAGRLLDRMLASIGLDRTRVYITNTILWRPPGNRNPSDVEVQAMLPFLHRQIELIRPKLLMTTGNVPLKALFQGAGGITRERGKWRDHKASGDAIPTLPVYHPAYLLRQPQLKRDAWADLRAFRAKAEELGIVG